MNPMDVWRTIGEQVAVHTSETSHSIPESPGIYAWFLPLWVYREDLNELVALVNRLNSYDALVDGPPQQRIVASFRWQQLDLLARIQPRAGVTRNMVENWREALADPVARHAIDTALMAASIVMPPLYVGKADNLRVRYEQHIATNEASGNVFAGRFRRHSTSCDQELAVSDLLFLSISLDYSTHATLESLGLNRLLEQIVMQMCRPPFSMR